MKFGSSCITWVMSLLLTAALSACGGGGGEGDSASSSGSGSGPGSGTSGSTSCSITTTDPLVAVSLTGVVGSAQFSGGGNQLTYANGLNGAFVLQADTNGSGCLDAGASASSMHTAMQAGSAGLGVSHVSVSGVSQPALLLNSRGLLSNASVSALQGNYVVLRIQQENTQTRMSYVSLSVDASGNWSMCKNSSSCATPTATGTIVATPGSSNRFDFSSGGLVRGQLFVMGTGPNRVLVVAEHDTGDGLVTGLHLGMPQAAWATMPGNYLLNTTDNAVNLLSLTSSSVTANGQSHGLVTDSPITGLATATATETNYLLASPSGLLVTGSNTGNNFTNGPAFFSFGIQP